MDQKNTSIKPDVILAHEYQERMSHVRGMAEEMMASSTQHPARELVAQVLNYATGEGLSVADSLVLLSQAITNVGESKIALTELQINDIKAELKKRMSGLPSDAPREA